MEFETFLKLNIYICIKISLLKLVIQNAITINTTVQSFIAQLLHLCMKKVLSHASIAVAALQRALYSGT